MDDAQRDQIGTQTAIGFIREQPDRFIPLALNRLGYFFALDKRVLIYFYSNNILGFIPGPILLVISAILLLPFVIISISSALGAALIKWNSKSFMLFILFFMYILPHVFILSEDRFHLALIPYFSILAVYFWINGFPAIAGRWRESGHGKLAVTLAAFAVFLLVANWGLELTRDADKIAALFGPNGNTTHYPY